MKEEFESIINFHALEYLEEENDEVVSRLKKEINDLSSDSNLNYNEIYEKITKNMKNLTYICMKKNLKRENYTNKKEMLKLILIININSLLYQKIMR